MGNRVIQYFTWMMLDLYGRAWLDEHIHGWVAVGAPWLGAPKMCRALVCTVANISPDLNTDYRRAHGLGSLIDDEGRDCLFQISRDDHVLGTRKDGCLLEEFETVSLI